MRTALTMRDLDIIMYVFESRVATSDQLRRKFFAHTKKDSGCTRNRIRMLYRAGYLRPCLTMVGQNVYRYFEVTDQAFQHICNRSGLHIDKPKYKSESPYHDIRLNELRFVFEKLKLYESYYPENMLQSASVLQFEPRTGDAAKMQSDGILLLKTEDNTEFNFAIELETSKKSPERYEKKLMSYYSSAGQLDGILYICSDQQIINAIVKADQIAREGQKSILHYALEANVLKSIDQIIFKNAKEGSIRLY